MKVYCKRTGKIKKLSDKLEEEILIYIRSPRGTGKTSFAVLIKEYNNIFKKFDQVHHLIMSPNTDSLKLFKEETQFDSFNNLNKNHKKEKPILIIIDDAQLLYGKDKTILHEIKPYLDIQDEKKNVFILILATHGEATIGKELSTPFPVESEQTLGISFLLFEKKEYEEAIKSYNERSNIRIDFNKMNSSLSFFHLTTGHTGFLSYSLKKIEQFFEPKNNIGAEKIIVKPKIRDVINFIYSDDFFDKLVGYKSFDSLSSTKSESTEDYKQNCPIARKILIKLTKSIDQKLKIIDDSESDNYRDTEIGKSIATFLMKMGIVVFVDDDSKITWSFDYMRIYWLKKLGKEIVISTLKECNDINEFILQFLKLIPLDRLQDQIDENGENLKNHSEAFWQNEFYRIAISLLGLKGVHPEHGRIKEGEGRVDFYVNSIKKWAVEFLINSSLIEEHCDDFNSLTGRYKDFGIKNFQIVNFVKHKPHKQTLETHKGVTFVYFNPKLNNKKAMVYLFRRNKIELVEQETKKEIKKELKKRKKESNKNDEESNKNVEETKKEKKSRGRPKGTTKGAKKEIKKGNENLINGSYDEVIVIDYTNQLLPKTLSLQLVEGDKIIGKAKIEEVPVILEAFKNKIRDLFKDYLKEDQSFSLVYDDKVIENDNQLAHVLTGATIQVMIANEDNDN
jgi:uncharacterized protein YlzI (FlbEa/FlbD family)